MAERTKSDDVLSQIFYRRWPHAQTNQKYFSEERRPTWKTLFRDYQGVGFQQCIQNTHADQSLIGVQGSWGVVTDKKTVRIWDLKAGTCFRNLVGHTAYVTAFTIQGKNLISGGEDQSIRIWDIESGGSLCIKEAHADEVTCLAIEGERFVSGCAEIKMWDLNTGVCLKTYPCESEYVTCVALHDKWVVTGGSDFTIRIWNANSGKCLQELIGHEDEISGLAIQETTLVSGSADSTLRVWDLEERRLPSTYSMDMSMLLQVWLFKTI